MEHGREFCVEPTAPIPRAHLGEPENPRACPGKPVANPQIWAARCDAGDGQPRPVERLWNKKPPEIRQAR